MRKFSLKDISIALSLLVVVSFLVLPSLKSFYRLVFADNDLVSAVYQDTNGDGTVDRIRWILDEHVATCDYEAGDWSVDVPGDMNVVITGISCTGTDAFLDIAVDAEQNITGSFSDPVLSYSNQGTADDVILASGPMTDKLSISASDNAAPVLIPVPSNPLYADSDGDGVVDLVYLFFTEVVDYIYNDADWSAIPNGLHGFDVVDCLSCFGDSALQLLVTANNGLTGVSGGTEPTLAYTANSLILDSSGNSVINFGPVSLFDNAAPTLISAVYLDSNLDGTIDTIRTTWSENVTMSGSTIDDWIIDPGSINAEFALASDDPVPGLTLDILVTADVHKTGSSSDLIIAYINDNFNDSVMDHSLPAGTTLFHAVLDRASPLVLSWSLDTDLKLLTLNFTEEVDVSTLVATGITIQDAATATESVTLTGGTTASADGAQIVIDLLEADVDALQANTSLATSTSNAFLRITSGVIDDLVGNSVIALIDGSALQASQVDVPAVATGGRRRTESLLSVSLSEGEGTHMSASDDPSDDEPSSEKPEDDSEAISEKNQEMDFMSDVVGDLEQAAILRLIELGVVQGNPDGNFAPQSPLKRAAAIKMIGLLMEVTPDRARVGDKWYSSLQRALRRAGVINGSIHPDTFELRANFLALVVKSQMKRLEDLPACVVQSFDDVLIDRWYCPVVQYARSQEWIRETSGSFNPSGVATRSWAAGVLDRVFQ